MHERRRGREGEEDRKGVERERKRGGGGGKIRKRKEEERGRGREQSGRAVQEERRGGEER